MIRPIKTTQRSCLKGLIKSLYKAYQDYLSGLDKAYQYHLMLRPALFLVKVLSKDLWSPFGEFG